MPTRLAARSPLLRLQSDEKLIALTRTGSHHAYETLVKRYHARLLAFCRHMLASKEDAEDVLQEVFAAAFNAIHADDRAIAVKPWLYRIARNRCLNHLRRAQPIGVDSMDVHLAEGGQTTADKVSRREEFRHLVEDVQQLAETQKTALLLREMEALSYEQIAEAMDTTVPAVKSLLVRARMALAESAESRKLSCEQVRYELGEAAEGLTKKLSPPIRRHLRHCERCDGFRRHLRETNKALAAVFPIGPVLLIKKLALAKLGHAAGGGGAAAGGALAGGSAMSGLASAGFGAVATKAAAGLAAAALVTAGAVEVDHVAGPAHDKGTDRAAVSAPVATTHPTATIVGATHHAATPVPVHVVRHRAFAPAVHHEAKPRSEAHAGPPAKAEPVKAATPAKPRPTRPAPAPAPAPAATPAPAPAAAPVTPAPTAGATTIVSETTTLPSAQPTGSGTATETSSTQISQPPSYPSSGTTTSSAPPSSTTPPATTTPVPVVGTTLPVPPPAIVPPTGGVTSGTPAR